jgi:AcrR family transcriptional regulator
VSTEAKRAGVRTPSRDLEAALVDAAEAVLVREGPQGVTVRAVAIEAGVAPMGVYNRFGNKEGLIEAVLIRGFERLRQAVAGRGEADPLERLRNCGIRYREFALANQRHYLAMFGDGLSSGPPSEALMLCSGAAFDELVKNVEIAMAAGRLQAADPRDIAQQIWSSVHGAVTLEMTGRVRTPDPEASYLALLDLITKGLVAPGDAV